MIKVGEYFSEPMVSALACQLEAIVGRSETGCTNLVD